MGTVRYDFSGENFLVTGASSGMGKQIAVELAEAGATVLAMDLHENEELKTRFPKQIVYGIANVCEYDAVESVINAFVAEHGKLNGLVHCAGIVGFTPLRMYDEMLAKRIMDISYWAGVKLVQICSKVKNVADGASFVLFSSVRSYETGKGLFAYASAKSSMRTAVKAFAKEFNTKKKLRINTISPGLITSGMTAGLEETNNLEDFKAQTVLGAGCPTDISGVVLFLLSEKARWITGTDIVVDGGYLA